MTTINQELKQLRRELGKTIRTVSLETGIPRSTLSDLENGTHNTRYATVIALQNYYTEKLKEKNNGI